MPGGGHLHTRTQSGLDSLGETEALGQRERGGKANKPQRIRRSSRKSQPGVGGEAGEETLAQHSVHESAWAEKDATWLDRDQTLSLDSRPMMGPTSDL